MRPRTYLVTGGAGFLGAALVRRLVGDGHRVRVLDNQSRGAMTRLRDVQGGCEFIEADVRDGEAVRRAAAGVDSVCHLAFINGTEFFYTQPELVLDVGIKGMLNVLEGCREQRIATLLVVSSSEVYQTPPTIPTAEDVPLSIPDPLNPRYSYAAGKILSEILALHAGRKLCDRVLIVRPHNVYGPDMGEEHVIPQFIRRMQELARDESDPIPFPLQGTGQETRAFVFIEDFIDAVMLVLGHGDDGNIYHIGTTEEVTMATVAEMVAAYFGRRIVVRPGPPAPGSTLRRCPDISKMRALGYAPRYALRDGVPLTARWYVEHARPPSLAAARVRHP